MYVQIILTKARSAKSPFLKKSSYIPHSTFFVIFLILSSNCSHLTFWTQRDPIPFTSLWDPYASAHFCLYFFSYPTYRLQGSSLQPLSYLSSSLLCPRTTCLYTHNTEAINLRGKAHVWNRGNCIFIMVASINGPGPAKLLGNSVSIESKGIPNLLWFTVTLIISCCLRRLNPLWQWQEAGRSIEAASGHNCYQTQANSWKPPGEWPAPSM